MVDLSDADLNQDGDESLAERLARDDPIFEPTTLNQLAEADLPFRGPLRKRAIENARDAAIERRTIEGVSRRIASNISNPISQVIEQSIRERVQERIQQSATRAATNIDNMRQ